MAGAGFAGTITALILHQKGFKVCLVESGRHPRFAIGESSTPVADMILRKLAADYDISWLNDFSRYGSWQRTHPEIVCGLKRGFSFFKHQAGKYFETNEDHDNELLVAASSDDQQSDTNWFRSDFDSFLVDKVIESGIQYFDLAEIVSLKRSSRWTFVVSGSDGIINIDASFFIDATGSGKLLEKLFDIRTSADNLLTQSSALFSHFENIPEWTKLLKQQNIPVIDFPYNPDNSALHHLLDEGWLWQLRFNNRRTSMGFVLDMFKGRFDQLSDEELWNVLLKKYPSIDRIFLPAELSPLPGRFFRTGRLQRQLDRCFDTGWVALPNTAGFIDPLYSTGIAHSLSGIQKLAGLFNLFDEPALFYNGLREYEQGIFAELKFIDLLVAGSYRAMCDFKLFNAWSMLYFAATISYEQSLLRNEQNGYFLGANNPLIEDMVALSYADLLKITDQRQPTQKEIKHFTEAVRARIAPANTAGLLDPSLKNMYRHTAAQL